MSVQNTKWVLDPQHSELGFKIQHLMISKVSGAFQDFDVLVTTQGNDFDTAEVQFNAAANSIVTNNTERDKHLKNADFFEVQTYPSITFESTKFEKKSKDSFFLWGTLTMKGVTQQVKLDATSSGVITDPWGAERAGFSISGKINRKDWGIHFNQTLETGGVMLGEMVTINSEIQLKKVDD